MNKKIKIIIFTLILLAIIFIAFFNFYKYFRRFASEKNFFTKVGIITDIHYCQAVNPNGVTKEMLDKFAKDVDEKKTDFNVNLGDNACYRVNKCSQTGRYDFPFIYNNLKTQSSLHYVVGDHDINGKESFDRWIEITKNQKSYYSFVSGDLLVLFLDTVTGGNEVFYKCEEDEECSSAKNKYDEYRAILKNENQLQKYLEENQITEEELERQKIENRERYLARERIVKNSYSVENWDRGSINKEQMNWIKNEIENSDKDKVLIFSHNPLFKFSSDKKYGIDNLEELNEILYNSKKQIVSISGEVHMWHEEKINNVQYYAVDRFINETYNWAVFEWNEDGYRLEKIIR